MLDACYAGAVPMDLGHSEQERISHAMVQAQKRLDDSSQEFGDIELKLNRAIGWAADLPQAYKFACDKVRRRLNQAVFTRLMVFEDGVAAFEYTEGMDLLIQNNPKVVAMPM